MKRFGLSKLFACNRAFLILAFMFYAAWAAAQNCSSPAPNVLTYHNDNCRTGQNVQETTFTPSNVSSSQFGRLFVHNVTGTIVGQPLYMSGLSIAGGTHNVVFVVTDSDMVYAFDADNITGANSNPLWSQTMLDSAHGAGSGETPADKGGGIKSTPVIDPTTHTMYVEAKSQSGSTYIHRLHALDIFTGNEKSPGPVRLSCVAPACTVAGIGDGGSTITFNELNQMSRPGLLLTNGTIYAGLASDGGDFAFGQYYGWVFAFDEATLSQKIPFVTTPNAVFNPPNATQAGGGIWMSGAGLAGDSSGNVFVATGNGLFDSNSDYGDSILKLALSGNNVSLLDYFTPFNQNTLNVDDLDLGSGGVLLLPDQTSSPQHLLVQVGKGDTSGASTVYLLNRDQLTTDNGHYCSGCNSDHVQQELTDAVGRMWGMPTYWNNKVYFWGTNDTLRAYTLSNSALSTSPTFTSADTYIHSANTSVSANGTSNGIVWAAEAVDSPPPGTPAMILNAYDATNANRLYTSADNDARDNAGGDVHFLVPTIANGKVYLGGTQLSVYGRNPPDFSLSVSPTFNSFPQGGGSANYVVTVTPVNCCFIASVTLTLTNLPTGASYSCSPNPVTGGSGTSTCRVTTTGSTPIGLFNFTINGSGGGMTHQLGAQGFQHGTIIVRPTTGQNPYSCCGIYQNFSSAFDGNLGTYSNPLGVTSPSQAVWYGFSNVSGTPTSVTLKVSSAYNVDSYFLHWVGEQYSLDAGSTWHTVYYTGFGVASSRGQQTDSFSLSTSQNLANVWVEGFITGFPPSVNQKMYEIWIEVTE